MKILLLFFWLVPAWSQLKVVTTTTNLKAVTEAIGGDKVSVTSFAKGTQDPHFLEAKPSYMVKASRANLLIQIGLGLEDGWLPLIIRGSRNPDIRPGEKGHLDASMGVAILEKITGVVSRSDGDVHPEGNPHFMLDPLQAVIVAKNIAKKLSELDRENATLYQSNTEKFVGEMNEIVKRGQKILKDKNKKIITYHKTLNYFNHRFGLKNLAYLEPKPGVPPTASHIIKVIQLAKKEKPKHILIENYFDTSVGNRVISELKTAELHTVPVAVEGEPGLKNLSDLYQKLLLIVGDEIQWKL